MIVSSKRDFHQMLVKLDDGRRVIFNLSSDENVMMLSFVCNDTPRFFNIVKQAGLDTPIKMFKAFKNKLEGARRDLEIFGDGWKAASAFIRQLSAGVEGGSHVD